MEKKYAPIACHFYDELEALAVKKVKSHIKFLKDENECEIDDFIVDFITANKEEFMVLGQGEKIRLDNIISVNDFEPSNYC